MKTNMDRGSLVENAVAKNDTPLLNKLLKVEQYDVKCLEGALTRAVTDKNVEVIQHLLKHFWSWDVDKALWVVFSAAAEAGRDKFTRLATSIKLRHRSHTTTK